MPFNRRYRVVYFTELDEHNKDGEINDAMRGEHIFDGFFRNYVKEEAKRGVSVLERLNAGETLEPDGNRTGAKALPGLNPAESIYRGRMLATCSSPAVNFVKLSSDLCDASSRRSFR